VTDEFDLLPLFPLPNVVLFPRAILPLHVFEPRYRTMMADVLGGGQTLVISLLKPGWENDYYGSPEVHPFACVGRVIQHQMLTDGRYNIMVQGEEKVLLERFEREQPYRIVRVRRVPEDLAWGASPGAGGLASQLIELYRRALQRRGTALDLEHILGPDVSAETVINTIAMNVDAEPETRQQLLELEGLELRFRALQQLLRESTRTQDVIERVRHLYPNDLRRN